MKAFLTRSTVLTNDSDSGFRVYTSDCQIGNLTYIVKTFDSMLEAERAMSFLNWLYFNFN